MRKKALWCKSKYYPSDARFCLIHKSVCSEGSATFAIPWGLGRGGAHRLARELSDPSHIQEANSALVIWFSGDYVEA